MTLVADVRTSKWFDPTYNITIALKSIDGLVEVGTGFVLLCMPSMVHNLLTDIVGEASSQGGAVWSWVAHQVTTLNTSLSSYSLGLLILFLLTNGGIKLLLVYCLYKRFYRAYPYIIIVLTVMVAIQLIPLSRDPTSIVLWMMMLLDCAVIVMALEEYKNLRELHADEAKS